MRGLNINEGGSGSSIVNLYATSEPNGKGVQLKTTNEEKKRLQELEVERMNPLNNIMRIRANEPDGLDKGDPNKVWRYETIETMAYGEVDALRKGQRKATTLKNQILISGISIQSFNVHIFSIQAC
ncbi:unnamed protein product [Lactuca saligna]|uniref:Uncharacterized protein n=1 Tax=Lactuca saligna TaxID=75948 RepID=A0AA36ERE8_LACSI|nr:unnamed protein product [Lactuca saligna]